MTEQPGFYRSVSYGRIELHAASGGSSPSIPDWYRDDLMNEYRALMQRAAWLKAVLGLR